MNRLASQVSLPSRFRTRLLAAMLSWLCISGAALADMSSVNRDIWKMLYGVNPSDATNPAWLAQDTDGDGASNEEELFSGTNPFSPAKSIKVSGVVLSGGQAQLSFPTEDGKRYRAEATTSLSAPSWAIQNSGTTTVITGDGTAKMLSVTHSGDRFYRIRVDDLDADSDGLSTWAEKKAGFDPNDATTNGSSDTTALPDAINESNIVTVTVTRSSATQPADAVTAPLESGSITISRSGILKFNAITVPLQISGSALEAVDYDDLPASVTLAAGVAERVLTINPKHNPGRRTNVTAIVKALAGPNYTLGGKTSGSVLINPPGLANGTGLTAQYHNASSSTYSSQQTIFSGSAELTRVDARIDFNGIASIATGNPCTVTTVAPHGLTTGNTVMITNVSGGTFSPTINGFFVVTVTGASTFTVASNCTAVPSSLQIASVCGLNGISSVSTTGNPTTVTTRVPHGFGANGTQVPVAINWLNGASAGINATHTATVTGTSTFTIPFTNTLAPSSSNLSVATISGPSGVNGWGSTAGPTGMSPAATGGAWSVRWTGQILPKYSETYTFDLRTNATRGKLWVNGKLLIDPGWGIQTSATEYLNTIALKAGVLYDIQAEYWTSAPSTGTTGNAEARLYWWSPSQTKEIVPQGRLFPAPAQAGKFTAMTSALKATGYVSVPFTFALTSTVTGGTTTYALATDSGPLPPGLVLNSSTGVISGTPTVAGIYNVAIDSTNTAAATVTGSTVVDITIFPTGSITRETLVGSTITADGTIPALDDDTNYGDNVSRRLRGYFVPPKTGGYYFWIAASSAAELWISNDFESVNRVRRATVTSSGNKTWNAAASQQSQWIALEEGQSYYVEVLHNTGTGIADDYVSVGWLQDDVGTALAVTGDANPGGLTPVIPNGGGALQGYPISGTMPSHVFQPYDYPSVTPPDGELYAANMGPQAAAQTSANGSVNLRVNAAQTQGILYFTYQGLGSPKTSYHLHVDGYTGSDSVVHGAGEIIYDIDDADFFNTKTADGGYIWDFAPTGSFSSIAQIQEAIQLGKVYLNIHSVNYPNGEIRGTLQLIEGSQTPPVPADYAEPIASDNSATDAGASRFLNQATYGASPADIAYVKTNGFEAWINDQLTKTASRTSNDVVAGITADINQPYPTSLFLNAWWKYSITGGDQLRQRLAFALSEILVVSWQDNVGPLRDNGRILADYHDNLVDYCLPTAGLTDSGNFRGVLKGVTLTPAMGLFLDMRGNQKGDPTIGRHPNENYAREIMQLFSIGLFRMWDDGKFVLGSDAGLVPTYTQPTIIGLSKLLTGWNYSQNNQASGRLPSGFGPAADYLNPMVLVPTRHDLEPKLLLDNVVSPGATGLTPRVTVSSVTTGSPCDINTSSQHGLSVGDTVRIANITGGTFSAPINAVHQVTAIVDADSFRVGINCTGAPSSYTNAMATGANVLPPSFTSTQYASTTALAPITGSQADNAGSTPIPHPYDQYGLKELELAIDNIMANDAVAPFICRRLIQRLTTSDPSPGYVYRVVQKFKNNGSGVRGDLTAVVKQILLDGEARSYGLPQGTFTTEDRNAFGKQREPMLRLTGPARSFPAAPYTGTYVQLTGANSHRLRITTSALNDFSAGFTVNLDFRGNYVNPPVGQTVDPYTNPTSTNYSVATTTGIAKTWTTVASIGIGNPCPVTTSEPHGLSTGNTIRITGLSTTTGIGGAFSYNGGASSNSTIISGTSRAVTVTGANSFTIDLVNCTTAPTDISTAKLVSNPVRITTTVPHDLTTGDSITLTGISGGTFSPTVSNATFTVTVVDATSFTIASACTAASTDNTGSIVGGNTLDVNATGMTNATYSQTAGSNILTVNTGGPQTNVAVPGAATTNVPIASISTGNPCTITTSAAHNLVSGGVVSIAGAGADGVFTTSINGTFVPTVIDGTSFTVPVECTTAATAGGTSSKLIRSKVYLHFLTQTSAGGAVLPTSSVFEVVSTSGSTSFTVVTADTPVTARGGSVIVPKIGTSYTPMSSNTVVKFNNNVNHNMLVGQNIWADVPVVTSPLRDAEYLITVVEDEDHFRTSSQPANLNGGTYPNPSGSNNGVTIYPLVPPPLGRSGVVTINQSTFNLGGTDSTLSQSPLNAPTVFNYFLSDYKYPGSLANNGVDSPEFQLTTDTNVVNLTNSIVNMIIGTGGSNSNLNGLSSFNNGNGSVVMDIGPHMTDAETANGGIPGLVDKLANLLCGAPLTTTSRTAIINCVANNTNFPYTTSPGPTPTQKRDRVRAIIHLIITTAEYAVQK